MEWSGFLSEGYELKDSAEAEAAFGKAFTAVYGGAVQDLVFTALTDTRFYGLNYNIPSLCFGASGAAMHGFNEYVDLELAAEIDQGHRAVHRGMVRGGEGVDEAGGSNHVIASEAKQSSFGQAERKLDCVVASAPRNDGGECVVRRWVERSDTHHGSHER